MESLVSKKKLPAYLEKLSRVVRRCLFWMPSSKKNIVEPKIDKITKNIPGDDIKSNNIELVKKINCNFCNRCEDCECEFSKEKKKKEELNEFLIDRSALNYFVFIIFFTFILVCNTSIWLMISV